MMPEFTTINYLAVGNARQQEVFRLLTSHRLMEVLKPFDAVLTGTIPLAIDIDTSDLDIICYCRDFAEFTTVLHEHFAGYPNYRLVETLIQGRPTLMARFDLERWPVEIFGQQRPVAEQEAFIHMLNEYRVLQEKGADFREQVLQLKRSGLKTEPAFARALGLAGDPYVAMLQLYDGLPGNRQQ